MYARLSREATKWVPDAVRIDTFGFESVSDSGDGDEGEGGVEWASEPIVGSESLGRCHIAPVFGCLATPKDI